MWPFKRKQHRAESDQRRKNINRQSQIEIVAHKQATKREVQGVQKANETLSNIFHENGFTLKIYLAAGGRHPKPQGTK